MASGSGRGTDPAWKYGLPIEGNKFGTTCVFCSNSFQSGGITRLKGHLAGYDPHKSVKKCDKVPPEVRHEVTAWIKKKELVKQEKAAVEEDIREELRNDYLGSQEIPYDDDNDDDDGYQYPEDMYPSERGGYREAIRRSTVDRQNSPFMRSASSRFPPKSKGGSSSHHWQQGDRSKSYQYQFPDPSKNPMPPKDSRPKQSKVKSLLTGAREIVRKSTAGFFIFGGVPANKVEDPHFKMMMSDRAEYGPGVKLPTAYEIQGPCLNEAYDEMKRYVDGHRKTWETFGCTLMCDGWTGPTKLSFINFMVYSKGAGVFLKSVDASHKKKSASYIYSLLDNIIQDIGPDNVVQIVTDNASAFKKAGRELEKKYPLYWIPCAAHCIDLIFEDIGNRQLVANVVKNAQSVTNYIYNHGWVLAEMRSITHGDLVRPGKTRFATNYIAIDSILKYKASLRTLFTSSKWIEHSASRTKEGNRVERRILDASFWDGMDTVHKIYKPLYEILRIVDTEIQPTMPILYDMFQRVKQQISQMPGKQWVLDIIETRWDKTISQPLHATAHFLNPNFQYTPGVGHGRIFSKAISKVFEQYTRIGTGTDAVDTFLDEIVCFRDAKGSFGQTLAKKTRGTRSSADWWAQWGYSAPNVSRIAMRILAQTASSSACERNWSTFALIHTKQWNRLAYQKLEKLVYCYYNMKLRLRDKRAKDNPMNENTYIDLLHVASEPLQNGIDPLHDWIMPAHLDDENGNPPPHVVEKASDFGIDVNRVLSEEVGDPGDDSDSVSVWGGVATPDSSDDDDDGGDGSGGGGGDTRFEYGQSGEGGRFEQFTCESNFDHATQDEDHGSRAGGHGAQQQDKYGRRTRVIDDDQSTPSDVASVALSFDSISIGTEHSGTSNESHEVNYQSGYPIHDYGQFGEVYDQSLSWIHPYYPILGETVGNSKDIYDYHVNHYNSYYMGRMSWAEYCTFADQRASFQAPRASFWY